jgi:hypothetical protein
MVALADDWRLTEEQAFHFLKPARVLSYWQSIFGEEAPATSPKEMLAAIAEYASMDDDLSDFIMD